MAWRIVAAAIVAAGSTGAALPATAEPLFWGIQVDRLEYRLGEDSDVAAWDLDATVGTDEVRVVLRSEAEYGTESDAFEVLEHQLRVSTPISDFFDVVGGVRVDTPAGPDRVYGLVGVQGLLPQWIELDAALFFSDEVAVRVEAGYEIAITGRLMLTPEVEFDLPLTDDTEIGVAAFGPSLEAGVRLSYDLVDRAIVPYLGVHYERAFGETEALARADGDDPNALRLVTGLRLMY